MNGSFGKIEHILLMALDKVMLIASATILLDATFLEWNRNVVQSMILFFFFRHDYWN